MTARGDPSQRRSRLGLLVAAALFIILLGSSIPGADAWGAPAPPPPPSESECRPYIEKALKEIEGTDSDCEGEGCDTASKEVSTEEDGGGESTEGEASAEAEGQVEETNDETESKEGETAEETSKEDETKEASAEDATDAESTEGAESKEEVTETAESQEATELGTSADDGAESQETKEESVEEKDSKDETKEESVEEAGAESVEDAGAGIQEEEGAAGSQEEATGSQEEAGAAGSQEEEAAGSQEEAAAGSQEEEAAAGSQEEEAGAGSQEEEAGAESKEDTKEQSAEDTDAAESAEETKEESAEEAGAESKEETKEESAEEAAAESAEGGAAESAEGGAAESTEDTKEESGEATAESTEDKEGSVEEAGVSSKEDTKEESAEAGGAESTEDTKEESAEGAAADSKENTKEESGEDAAAESKEDAKEGSEEDTKEADSKEDGDRGESAENPEEDLTLEIEVPENLRPREHIANILKLDAESAETEMLLQKTVDVTLRELKRLYDSAIKPLEILYKYRDLSNRHFGDPEIFSKPLILFMGPWSGGKSTIINYLLGTEFTPQSLRTGAEPSPAYFNILMHGERYEVLDGTQLAADWTFSGLQKFGQGLLDRLRGVRLNNPLLEKVNIVEIPGILEIRKQVERVFPFNDACQWFIDRADIIFLVYDPSKLDVGPETEAILDQLKGREYQTRIILNKADQVKPEELMRVQGTLIWNISPLMSSAEPPVMYSTSLWSMPYESGAPLRLLSAQEKAFLRDLRTAFDKRVENKIASARRFAVRVRNHAKMVDCYLTTYYNHKSFFGNKKKVSDDIIEHPQDYHIYEGLSTLTNISRYDLPDPDSYRDFFRLNPLFEFQQLAATCTYFRGCPINRLDVAIAYDLPELVGKYKNNVEDTLDSVSNSNGPPKS